MRVDSGVDAGTEVTPLYDPMVAKLITWDTDREQATARMLRALGEYEIGGLVTLIPFHRAILATEQWREAETCRDLPRTEVAEIARAVARELPAAGPATPGPTGRRARGAEERNYKVEVDGRLHGVKVIGAAARANPGAGTGRRRPPRRERAAGGGARPAAPRRSSRRFRAPC